MGDTFIYKIDYPDDENVQKNYQALTTANGGATTGTLEVKKVGEKFYITNFPNLSKDDTLYIVTHGSWLGKLLAKIDGSPQELDASVIADAVDQKAASNPKAIQLVACHSYRSAKALAGLIPPTKVTGFLTSVTVKEGSPRCVKGDTLYGPNIGKLRFQKANGTLEVHGFENVAPNMVDGDLDAEDKAKIK